MLMQNSQLGLKFGLIFVEVIVFNCVFVILIIFYFRCFFVFIDNNVVDFVLIVMFNYRLLFLLCISNSECCRFNLIYLNLVKKKLYEFKIVYLNSFFEEF